MTKSLIFALLIVPGICIGIYLTDVTTTSITINWITDRLADASVFVRDPHGNVVFSSTNDSPSSLHSFRITGLSAATEYDFGVHSFGEDFSFSRSGSFRTAPERSSAFVFAVYGDNRNNPRVHAEVVRGIRQHSPSIVLNTGDMVYHDSHVDEWLEFFDTISVLQGAVYYPVIGNHEKDAVNYMKFFNPPGNGRYYSFWYSDILFIVLNSNERFDPYSEQYRWLRRTLAEETANDPAFVFAAFHHPAYSFGYHGDHRFIKEYLVPVFEEFEVDAVFNGHDHAYQRIERGGITYLITAGGGAPLYYLREGDESLISAVRAHHYLVAEYDTGTLLFRCYDIEGRMIDSFSMVSRRLQRASIGEIPYPIF